MQYMYIEFKKRWIGALWFASIVKALNTNRTWFISGRIFGRCVKVTQNTFDIELLCHDMAQKLCHAAGKKYW